MSTSLTATIVDAAALADELVRVKLVSSERLNELLSEFTDSGSGPVALVEFLVARRVLTSFQALHVLQGNASFLSPGPYRIHDQLRIGTLGAVYRATHRSKPGEFAINVLPLRSLWQARQAKQLTRSFLRFSSSSGIVPLTDADSASSHHYLVWPATDDTLLSDRLAGSRRLTASEAAAMLTDVAEALVDCHARKLPHGAISPWAVGITKGGRARLLDFGVGALFAQNIGANESIFDTFTAAASVARMLDFAAPELIADPHNPNVTADLYSLGAVGFFALTGRLPFTNHTLSARLNAGQNSAQPLVRQVNAEIPIALSDIIDRMLRSNISDRYESAVEVQELLARVAEELDPARPVLVSRNSDSLADQHLAEAANHAPVWGAIPRPGRAPSGVISWNSVGSSAGCVPERDDSDASIQFELPPESTPISPGLPYQPMDTPCSAECETEPDTPPLRIIEADSRPVRSVESPSVEASPALPEAAIIATPTRLGDSRKLASILAHTEQPPTPNPDDSSDDLCSTLPVPVQWHINRPATAPPPAPGPSRDDEPVITDSVLWKKLKRNILFWQAPTDRVAVSVFGPLVLTPGKPVSLTVFLHHPDAVDSVSTLSRAFHKDAEFIGSGVIAREVARESLLAVHLAVMNAAATRSLLQTKWRGQPLRLTFDLHVPWESPSGDAPGLVSVGQDNIRIGKAAFNLRVLPRQA